jgi:hypothetical protein
MATSTIGAALGWGAIMIGALGACSSAESTCMVKCAPTAIIYPNLALSFDQLQRAHLTACRGQDCFDRDFSTLQPPAPGMSLVLPSSNVRGDSVGVTIQGSQSGLFSLSIEWVFTSTRAMNGDVFRVTVADESGNNLTTLEEAATYSHSAPTAGGCVSPCGSAIIDQRR